MCEFQLRLYYGLGYTRMSLNLQQQRNADLKLAQVVGYRCINFYEPVLMAAPLLTALGLERAAVTIILLQGLTPPLVTTKFRVQDYGNASPRYIRSTMYYVPGSEDMRKQTGESI